MLLFLFQQTCEPGGSQQGNPFFSLLPLILIFVIFYFLLILPQQRRQKQHRQLIEALKKGDRVVTSSGIYGTIVNVKDHTVILLIADGVKIEMDKAQVVHKVEQRREGA
ncbi:MAG: preprotein translocase subunit YajC [candidate division WOR-3 bacterium]|nr:MAG: preprotein translocase subunit YajC [candidate division WOR-3 bacterium]